MKKFLKKRADNFKTLGRAFKYRNYRLYFAGHSVSLIGYWMQRVALGWLVYRITDSPLKLGAIGFATLIPNFLISPFAGVLVDRVDRHKIILFGQILAAVQALLLAGLVFAETYLDYSTTHRILNAFGLGAVDVDTIKFWIIFSLSLVYGLIRSFDIPARNAFIVQMVERKENMGSAIALNSAVFNLARLIGPSIAGFVVAYAGEGICFVSNAVAYMAIIGCLLAMKLPPHTNYRKDNHPVQDFKEGVAYAFTNSYIRSILLLVAVIALTGLSYLNLMPVIARDVLGGDSRTFGFLMGSVGLGAVAGALVVGSRKSFVGMWNILAISAVLFGIGVIASSFSRNFYLTAVLMSVIGFGQMIQFACANTLIQNIVDDDKRGRVMSIYNVAILGLLPFGNLLMGWVANEIGAPLTLRIGGGISLLAALVFTRGLGKFEKLK